MMGRQNVRKQLRALGTRVDLDSSVRNGHSRQIYPAEALNTNVICVRPAWRAINDAVFQLIVRCGAGRPAEELAAILH